MGSTKLLLVGVLLLVVSVCYGGLPVEKEGNPVDAYTDETDETEDVNGEEDNLGDVIDEADDPDDEPSEMDDDTEELEVQGDPWWWSRRKTPKPRPRPRPRPVPPVPRPRPSGGSCTLTTYRGSNFRNSARVENGFADDIRRINSYAANCRVQVYVTSSFRNWGAGFSNHKVGHAIDINLIEGGQWCNKGSGCLGNPPARMPGVRCFIASIRRDSNLRWGDDFRRRDPGHIDDNLNNRDRALWNRLYNTLHSKC